MLRKSVFALVALSLLALSPAFGQRDVIIGEHITESYETPHPYPVQRDASTEPVWVDYISFPGAVYIAPHFAEFELAPGDYVIVRSEDGTQSWRYNGLGKRDLGRTKDGFFAAHIKGEVAVIELFTAERKKDRSADLSSRDQRFGYRIDYFGRGYSDAEIQDFWDQGLGERMNLPYPPSEHKSLCGTDDSREAKCYQSSEASAYNESEAVARLVKNGNAHCTGWLVGCDGHLMTNEHCIGDQAEANQIDFEFLAEGASCATNCASSLACGGTIEASGATLVAVDSALDYALVIPDTSTASNTDLPATYGYMQLRASGPVLNERIYIPQHPAGWGKRIALESSHSADSAGFAQISSVNETGCQSGSVTEVGYYADTQGGSSGSPVLGHSDDLVVALHHCRGSAACTGSGGDPNRGVPIDTIIADLGSNLPNCAVGNGNSTPAVSITAPANGTSVDVGTNVSFSGTANDSEDGNLTSSLSWSSSLDGNIGSGGSFSTSGLSLGAHTITASVTDSGGASGSDSITVSINDPNSNGPQNATYNSGLGAPSCAVAGSSCDSTTLLNGRGTVGPEANQPNTLDGCSDGTSGSYLSDESNERIVVSTLDNSDLTEGATVQIAATVYAWSTGTSDSLDLYYAADANNPSWVFIATLSPPAGGNQTLTATYTLPNGALQAVRASFRYQGSVAACSTGNYDDADDLVFAVNTVGPGNTAPNVTISSPTNGSSSTAGNSVSFAGNASDNEDGNISASLSWSSSLDGNIGSGASFSSSGLSLGSHTITASVTDSGGLSDSAQVSITINPGGGGCVDCIDWSTTTTVSYSTQDNSANVAVEDGGDTLLLTDNTWRRTSQTFNITANTVLEFDFQSTSEGEIHGIGFEEDDNISNATRIFQLHGTQNWGSANHDFDNYSGSAFTTYQIPVGQYYTGSGMFLALVNDHDAGSGNNSRFRNVRVFENGGGGGCTIEETFESNAGGWLNDGSSTCTTGSFVVGTPSEQVNSGVTTQVGGAHGGSNAFFSATNTSAGANDVDGGNCVVLSPTYSVTNASNVSAWYFHGQRDAGDDAGDGFSLEMSVNGGAWQTLASHGDEQVNAVWTEATSTVSAGSSVQFRIQVADATGGGDLVEAGIDDVSICDQ